MWNATLREATASTVSEISSLRTLGEVLTDFCVRPTGRFRSIRTRRLTLGLRLLGASERHLSRATRRRRRAHYRNPRGELMVAERLDLPVRSGCWTKTFASHTVFNTARRDRG